MFSSENQRGFTLIEVMIGILILGIIGMTITMFFAGGFANIRSFGRRSEAVSRASGILDRLLALDAGIVDWIEGDPEFSFVEGKPGEEKFTVRSEDDQVLIYFSKATPSGDPKGEAGEGYRVTVRVLYHDGESEVSLVSFIRGAGS